MDPGTEGTSKSSKDDILDEEDKKAHCRQKNVRNLVSRYESKDKDANGAGSTRLSGAQLINTYKISTSTSNWRGKANAFRHSKVEHNKQFFREKTSDKQDNDQASHKIEREEKGQLGKKEVTKNRTNHENGEIKNGANSLNLNPGYYYSIEELSASSSSGDSSLLNKTESCGNCALMVESSVKLLKKTKDLNSLFQQKDNKLRQVRDIVNNLHRDIEKLTKGKEELIRDVVHLNNSWQSTSDNNQLVYHHVKNRLEELQRNYLDSSKIEEQREISAEGNCLAQVNLALAECNQKMEQLNYVIEKNNLSLQDEKNEWKQEQEQLVRQLTELKSYLDKEEIQQFVEPDVIAEQLGNLNGQLQKFKQENCNLRQQIENMKLDNKKAIKVHESLLNEMKAKSQELNSALEENNQLKQKLKANNIFCDKRVELEEEKYLRRKVSIQSGEEFEDNEFLSFFSYSDDDGDRDEIKNHVKTDKDELGVDSVEDHVKVSVNLGVVSIEGFRRRLQTNRERIQSE